MHWDGAVWKRAALPPVAAVVGLNDVAALSSSDVWAVGFASSKFEEEVALALHWDGVRWRVIDLRGLAAKNSAFAAVDGSSSHDIWAVGCRGTYGYVAHEREDLAFHWNGSRWGEERRLEFGECLNAVDALTQRDVWGITEVAASNDYILHWNGRSRTEHEIGEGDVVTLAALSPTNVWAVGAAIMHWDGKGWTSSRPRFLDAGGDQGISLYGLSARSPTDIWSVGEHLIVRYTR